MSNLAPSIETVLSASDVHDFAKRVLRDALMQDVVDAINDLELVRLLLLEKHRQLCERNSGT